MWFLIGFVLTVVVSWKVVEGMIRSGKGWLVFLLWVALFLLIVTGAFSTILGEP